MQVIWKFEHICDSELFENTTKVRALIKKECCNYDNGNCVLLDNGEYRKCPQVTAERLMCGWFKKAVLPLDKILEVRIHGEKEQSQRKCAECSKSFVPANNKAKYCKKCVPKVVKRQNSERQRQKRSMSRNRVNL